MDWQAALRARLLAASPITALVAQRVYWMSRPQGSALPAITLQTISDEREQHMKGFHGVQSARVQVDVWGETYGSVRDIANKVIAALVPANTANGIRFDRGFVDSIRDLGERTETAFLHRASIDFIIHHATT
jgi:hypothetical protein